MKPHCKTWSGKRWFLLEPDPALVDLEDIAQALSKQCRFNGHVSEFYSVAQHAVLVAIEVWRQTQEPLLALHGLHHDDEEAYLGDMVRPVKRLPGIAAFSELGDKHQRAILAAIPEMGWDPGAPLKPPVVADVDARMCGTEQRDLTAAWADGSPPSPDAAPFPHITIVPELVGVSRRDIDTIFYRVNGDARRSTAPERRYSCWTHPSAAMAFLAVHEELVRLADRALSSTIMGLRKLGLISNDVAAPTPFDMTDAELAAETEAVERYVDEVRASFWAPQIDTQAERLKRALTNGDKALAWHAVGQLETIARLIRDRATEKA